LSKDGLLKGERCGFTSFDKLRTNGHLIARSVNWKTKDAKKRSLSRTETNPIILTKATLADHLVQQE